MVVLNGANLKLSDLFNGSESNFSTPSPSVVCSFDQDLDTVIELAQLKAERDWFGAIAALEQLLLPLTQGYTTENSNPQGLLLAGPMPILSHPDLLSGLYSCILTPKAWKQFIPLPFQLLGNGTQELRT